MHYYVFKGRQSGGPETRKVMMMNYEEMSKFEINRRVSEALGFTYIGRGSIDCADGVYHVVEMGGCRTDLREYCENPSHSWPIILQNKICIHNNLNGSSYACTFDNHGYVKHEFYCDDTLRAAMIVFLMIKSGKQG